MNLKYDFLTTTTGFANFITTNYTSINSNDFKETITAEEEFDSDGKYSIIEIANWFLLKSSMTHKKLQKLCYYAQAWYYALKGLRLIDSDFQAWVHGPVSPVLYEKFKCFGFDTIKISGLYETKINKEDQDFLEDVWETYGSYTGNALEALSHKETPWIQARAGYRPDEKCIIAISPEDMKKYYISIYKK